MTSKQMRSSSLFLRKSNDTQGQYDIPLVRKQEIDINAIELIPSTNTKSNDKNNIHKGVHFFVDDYRFEGIYNNPNKSLGKFSQYKFLLTPDFSTYAEMDIWKQIENVAKNRWCGSYWQSKGLTVIPTISWSTPKSYDFCFDGVEKKSIVAIGMIGCKKEKTAFLRGYNEMINRINPQAIICYGNPFEEMQGNIVQIDYLNSRKESL